MSYEYGSPLIAEQCHMNMAHHQSLNLHINMAHHKSLNCVIYEYGTPPIAEQVSYEYSSPPIAKFHMNMAYHQSLNSVIPLTTKPAASNSFKIKLLQVKRFWYRKIQRGCQVFSRFPWLYNIQEKRQVKRIQTQSQRDIFHRSAAGEANCHRLHKQARQLVWLLGYRN